MLISYLNFAEHARRCHRKSRKRAENFDVEKLEWFTIFVSVKDWKLKASRKASADVEVEADRSLQPGEDKEKEFDDENDTPAENVKKQLGFRKRYEVIMGHAKLPFLRNISKFNLWGNRNVL